MALAGVKVRFQEASQKEPIKSGGWVCLKIYLIFVGFSGNSLSVEGYPLQRGPLEKTQQGCKRIRIRT